MSFLFSIAIPEMKLSALTYKSPVNIPVGSRVIVEVQKKLHAGFVLGHAENNLPEEIAIKEIAGVIDNSCVIAPDLWDLALWAGRVCLCGAGAALKVMLPRPVYMGEKITASKWWSGQKTTPLYPPLTGGTREILPPLSRGGVAKGDGGVFCKKNFHERNFFSPLESERVKFFMSELDTPERTLILFPAKEIAKKFFLSLSGNLKAGTLLWTSPNFVMWELARSGQVKKIIAGPGGIFAPFSPQKIIIEQENSSSYIIPPVLNISARSLAGRRASFLGCELITAGSLPSLKTFMRAKPQEKIFPDKKNIILADIFRSKKESANGIEGDIPLTFSLIKRTYKALLEKNNVLWIFNRAGEALEVFCDHCGNVITCEKCGGVMRSLNDGEILRCRVCGALKKLPETCEKCGSKFFVGRRPGLDALEKILLRYYPDVHIYSEGSKKSQMHGLVLSTQRGLELLSYKKFSLVAWLDLDAELMHTEYFSRMNIFSLLWASYWRGRENAPDRKVLIQARSSGMKLAKFLALGWEKFFADELRTRKEFSLPPFSYIIEIECANEKIRGSLIKIFDDNNIFVMDPGESDAPLYVNTNNIDTIDRILEPKLKNSLKITVRSE